MALVDVPPSMVWRGTRTEDRSDLLAVVHPIGWGTRQIRFRQGIDWNRNSLTTSGFVILGVAISRIVRRPTSSQTQLLPTEWNSSLRRSQEGECDVEIVHLDTIAEQNHTTDDCRNAVRD